MHDAMSEPAKFESRTGKVTVSSKKLFDYITDMRNFKQFLPGKTIENWEATRENCTFEVFPVGKASLGIVEKEANSLVKFGGDGLNGTQFFLWVQIKEAAPGDTRVKLTIKADINPVLRAMAQKPIKDFLEKLMTGIESFEGWDEAME
ncbi:MAG: hypothetical protein E4G95_06195 [Bacteroidia bacterium]|nr:MAG: hypothetical protein E4G95_06195 [Bacteroidia bacterium]